MNYPNLELQLYNIWVLSRLFKWRQSSSIIISNIELAFVQVSNEKTFGDITYETS